MPPLNNLETPLSEKDRSAPSVGDLGAKLVRRAIDSGIDWLTEVQAVIPEGEDCGYLDFISGVDALVMGRHSFERVLIQPHFSEAFF